MPLNRVENGKLVLNIKTLLLGIAIITIVATLLTTTVTVAIGYADMKAELRYVVEDRGQDKYRYAGKDDLAKVEAILVEGGKRRDGQYTEIQRRLCAIEADLKKHMEKSIKP